MSYCLEAFGLEKSSPRDTRVFWPLSGMRTCCFSLFAACAFCISEQILWFSTSLHGLDDVLGACGHPSRCNASSRLLCKPKQDAMSRDAVLSQDSDELQTWSASSLRLLFPSCLTHQSVPTCFPESLRGGKKRVSVQSVPLHPPFPSAAAGVVK